jgi:26S proteasome regulatory subunit N11
MHLREQVIDYRKNELEEQMLTNLYKKTWVAGLITLDFACHTLANHEIIANMARHSENYNLRVRDEEGRTVEELLVANVGKVDPKRHLVSNADTHMCEVYPEPRNMASMK